VGAEMPGLSVFQGEMDTGAVDGQQRRPRHCRRSPCASS
jgi:hypothetical protein